MKDIAVSSCIVLLGCPEFTAVWLPHGATSSSLAFELGYEQGVSEPIDLRELRVHVCGTNSASRMGVAIWIISRETNERLSQVRFGETPMGFKSESKPPNLTPGCYIVQISGTGRMKFQVLNDGRVVDLGPPW